LYPPTGVQGASSHEAPQVSSGRRRSSHSGLDRDPSPLHVEVFGNGKPLILIHGFGSSSYTWRNLVRRAWPDHLILAVDLKGFGQAAKPRDGAYSLRDHARALEAFIVGLRTPSVSIVAHSMGGGVALLASARLLAENSCAIEKMALISPIAYPQPQPWFLQILRMRTIGWLATHLLPPELQTRKILKSAYLDETKIPRDAARMYAAPLRHGGGRHAILATARQMALEDVAEAADCSTRFPSKTLLIWGRQDTIVPLAVGRQLRRTIRRSTLAIIEDCGHLPQEEKPEATIQLIADFLHDNDPGSCRPPGSDRGVHPWPARAPSPDVRFE
jgi:pimeloyl-ACP methyl ester carboxylesterase